MSDIKNLLHIVRTGEKKKVVSNQFSDARIFCPEFIEYIKGESLPSKVFSLELGEIVCIVSEFDHTVDYGHPAYSIQDLEELLSIDFESDIVDFVHTAKTLFRGTEITCERIGDSSEDYQALQV